MSDVDEESNALPAETQSKENEIDHYAETDFAKAYKKKHKRDIILPAVIPWECGGRAYKLAKENKKEMRPFGSFRPQIPLAKDEFGEVLTGDQGSVPGHACESLYNRNLGKPDGQSPFGATNQNVKWTRLITGEHMTLAAAGYRPIELSKFNRANNSVNNASVNSQRGVILEVTNGHNTRRLTVEEKRHSESVIPKLMDPRNAPSSYPSGTGAGQGGYHSHRQVTSKIIGGEISPEDRAKSSLIGGWTNSGVSLQSQARTGGFNKIRDVIKGNDYYKPSLKPFIPMD